MPVHCVSSPHHVDLPECPQRSESIGETRGYRDGNGCNGGACPLWRTAVYAKAVGYVCEAKEAGCEARYEEDVEPKEPTFAEKSSSYGEDVAEG